jgi:hypothetical protein
MRRFARRCGLLVVLTGAGLVMSISSAGAHPLVIEGTGHTVPLVNDQQVVAFQCGALDYAAPLGTNLTECYVRSLVNGGVTHAQVKPTSALWSGTAVQYRGQYELCAGGYAIHTFGVRQDIPTQCRRSLLGEATLLLIGPIL